jgi:multidrug efflux pump subunit AcrA (membrane-fusion protein)
MTNPNPLNALNPLNPKYFIYRDIYILSHMKSPVALLLVAVLAAGCSRDRGVQASENKPRAVATEAAQVRELRRQVDVVGTLAAREEVVVSAEVDGRVARLVHDLGDRVSAGAPLIELDGEKLQYRAEAQRAALEQARARYGASPDSDLPPLDKVPNVVSTRAQMADAQQQLDRAKNLASRSLVSTSDLDTAQTRFPTTRRSRRRASSAPTSKRSRRRCGWRSATSATR